MTISFISSFKYAFSNFSSKFTKHPQIDVIYINYWHITISGFCQYEFVEYLHLLMQVQFTQLYWFFKQTLKTSNKGKGL